MDNNQAPQIQPYFPPLPFLQPPQDGQIGTNCEIRQYERVTNAKGEKVLLRSGSSRASLGNGPRDSWSAQSALVLIKDLGDDYCPRTELEIQSPYIKKALKTCVPAYEKIDVEGKPICLQDQPRCVFHYRQELMKYHNNCLEAGERDAALHVKFVLDYMFNTMSSEIRHFTYFMENPLMQPALEYLNLWMAFVPGDIIYAEAKFHDNKVGGFLMRLDSMTRCPCTRTWCEQYRWSLRAYIIDHNGTDFGHAPKRVNIQPYEGVKALQDLAVIPLRYHPDGDKIKAELIERGKKFVQFHGRHYKQCKGVAELLSNTRDTTMFGEDDLFPPRLTHVDGRIMVDSEAFSNARPSHQPYIVSTEKRFLTEHGQHLEMSEEELMICSDKVAGYSLNDKKWGWFEVDTIQDIDFNEDAFDSLIFHDDFKHLVLSLVKSHANGKLAFDDVIKGKGKGIVFLLHGEPGTGKTLTAAFLRAVEYFGGILFLTTNRIESFDRAFRSRIHLALYYPGLNSESRGKIWKGLLSRPGVDTDPELLHGNLLDQVVAEDLNGREIKNAVHMAHALAMSQQRPINKNHLDSALAAMRTFDKDWKDGMDAGDEEYANDTLGRPAKRRRAALDT
ncbi:hypothetical protein DL771_003351 [Monosporascus sp. 5C6A]|nr:hypothetical protein DL771_003351 [Monosporascus sp. 5C6A]